MSPTVIHLNYNGNTGLVFDSYLNQIKNCNVILNQIKNCNVIESYLNKKWQNICTGIYLFVIVFEIWKSNVFVYDLAELHLYLIPTFVFGPNPGRYNLSTTYIKEQCVL